MSRVAELLAETPGLEYGGETTTNQYTGATTYYSEYTGTEADVGQLYTRIRSLDPDATLVLDDKKFSVTVDERKIPSWRASFLLRCGRLLWTSVTTVSAAAFLCGQLGMEMPGLPEIFTTPT